MLTRAFLLLLLENALVEVLANQVETIMSKVEVGHGDRDVATAALEDWQTLKGEDAMEAITKLVEATSGRLNAVFDFAGSTNTHDEDKPLWDQIFGIKNSDGSEREAGLLKAWPKPPDLPTDELRRKFEAILLGVPLNLL